MSDISVIEQLSINSGDPDDQGYVVAIDDLLVRLDRESVRQAAEMKALLVRLRTAPHRP